MCYTFSTSELNHRGKMHNKLGKDKAALKPLNYEQVYQLINQKKWSDLIRLAHDYHKVISSDDMLENAFKTFENELFRNLDEISKDKDFSVNLSHLYLMHTCKIYQLPSEYFKKVCIELTKLHFANGEIETAYNYAKQFSQEKISLDVINEYEKSLPKIVEHSQSKNIKVIENKEIAQFNHAISLFKSKQEYDFFMAVREVFPMYTVYPNVAVSCIIDFEKIKLSLPQNEKDYFFTSIVDCVVFDHHKNYFPIYFFELDSSLHDSEIQKKKDIFKDKTLAYAGLKLYRIRKMSQLQGKNEFMQLIREVFER